MNTGLVQSIADLSNRWRNRFSPSKESSKHLELGARGERSAARYLRGQGYKILYRNFRGRRGGEIDIVCRDGDTLVFVEVKTRSGHEFGRPLEAVNLAKQKLIARGALAWLQLLDNPDILFRFDVVEVMMNSEGLETSVELVRDAFRLPAPYLY